MSRHYERRPRRDWDQTDRRSIGESVGWIRLLGFAAILAASFALLGRKDDAVAPAGTVPRIAADAAVAPIIRDRAPKAQLRSGTSSDLASDLRSGMAFDVVILSTDEVAQLAGEDRCSDAVAVAARDTTRYAACLANANGSSRELGTRVIDALTDLEGRDALLSAGFDIPEARPAGQGTSP